ncbi:MAG: S-layer homology domain-containing protein [Tissierellales bacterium]|nr:S-layer homology domain-containing protein [Tissierellales bacterium]MBN2828481.1 S-layer homology domain-containing protein [Tissierellales bacterium]
MRKTMKIVLAVMLVLSLAMMPVTAVAGGQSGSAPGQQKTGYAEQHAFSHSFNDMTGYDWAQKAVQTMARMGIIKGEGNGRFAPSRSAKEIEVVAMTLRFLGLEEELDLDAELPKYYKGTDPDEWMIPYIDAALEEGILLPEEMDDFNPNAASSRSRAAVYMIRALDMVEEAEDHMDEDLPFKDAGSIPEEHVGYVYLVNELGLMIGYNDTFQPNKPVTRAELAVLFARMVAMTDTEYSYTMTGRIYYLVLTGDKMIAIKSGSTYAQFDLDDDVVAYDLDDEEIELEDLNLNDFVKLYIVNDLVVQIDLIEEGTEVNKILLRRTGELIDITWDDDDLEIIEVLVTDTTTPEAFEVDEDVVIKVEGNEEDLLEAHIGLEIVFYTSNDVVYKVYVHYDKIEGILDELIYDDEDLVGAEITLDGEEESDSYMFAEDMQICINEVDSDLEDLEALDFEDDIVYEVNAKLLGDGTVINLCVNFEGPELAEGTGELTDITWEDDVVTELEILVTDATESETFEVDEDAVFKVEGVETDLTEAHVGLELTFYTSDDVIYEVDLEYDELEGVLNALVYEDEDLIGLDITPEGETEGEDYLFAEGVILFINEVESELEDLEDLDFESEIEYEVSASLLGNGELIIVSIDFDEPEEE